MRALLRSPHLLAALLLANGGAIGAEPPSRDQVAAAARAATAVVDVGVPGSRATAFCVHPSGLFLTTAPALQKEGDPGPTALILGAGTAGERSRPLRVVRRDPALRLVLVRVEGEKELTALPLGEVDKAAAQAEVVLAGVSQTAGGAGTAKAPSPPVALTVRKVKEVYIKDGEPTRIVLSQQVPGGYTGAALLDQGGRVVGVVTGIRTDRQVNFGEPVNAIKKFLHRPELTFRPPALDVDSVYKPVRFEARAEAAVPSAGPWELHLLLRGPDGPERRFPMERSGDVYRVIAAPLHAPPGGRDLTLTVHYADGAVSGRATDRPFKVGDQEFRLRATRHLRFRPEGQVRLADGGTASGAITGLDKVPFQIGDRVATLDLSRAVEVTVTAPLEVAASVVASTKDGKEAGRAQTIIPISDRPTNPQP